MPSSSVRPKCYATAVLVIALQCSAQLFAQDVRFKPVAKDIVKARLGKYAGKDNQRQITLKQMFAETGCDDQHLSEQTVKGSKLPNVICTLPGSSPGRRVIIVGAHFDHVDAGDGVVDNWSGASLLPSLYEAVKSTPRKHTYIFIGFTDEERGEVGSRFYARQMTKEDIDSTDAMVNLDSLGLGPAEVWASHSDKQLVAAFGYVSHFLNIPVGAVNVEKVGSTDSVQFSDRKIASITVHSLTQEKWNEHILHSSNDKISAIQLNDYYQTYRLLSAYLAFLDAADNIGAAKSR